MATDTFLDDIRGLWDRTTGRLIGYLDKNGDEQPTLDGNTAIAAAAIAGGAADATEFAATVAATYAPLVNPTFHDVVKVKNSTTAQELQVYNTASGTADADSEYGFVNWVSNELRIGTAKTGTGTSRHMRLYSAGVLYLAAANNGYVLTFGNGAFYSGGTKLGLGANGWSAFYLNYTNTATVGAVTINMPSGRVNVAASATSVVVTNSLVTAASHVIAQPSTNDSTGRVTAVVPAAGSFTIYLTAPAAQMSIDFVVFGAD